MWWKGREAGETKPGAAGSRTPERKKTAEGVRAFHAGGLPVASDHPARLGRGKKWRESFGLWRGGRSLVGLGAEG